MSEDTHRVVCESCGAKILAATAEIYGGYCVPCHERLNEIAASYQQPTSPESFLSKIFGFMVPIGIFSLFAALVGLGIPLGYKLVLGSPVEEGTIQQITLINSIPDLDLSGQYARIVSDYIVVELKSGRKIWIPEGNIAGIEFQSER